METSDAAREKKKEVWVLFVSELADKEQTKKKNWSYMPPFCLIKFKDLY